MLKSEKSKDYLVQGFLIVGSVLLALWLNELVSDYSVKQKKKQSIQNILTEIEDNLDEVNRVWEYHKSLSEKLGLHLDTLDFDSNNESAVEILGPYIPRGLQNAEVLSTAWTIALQSNIVSEFDYELAYDLASIYRLQSDGTVSTTKRIMDYLINPSLFDDEKNEEVIKVLHFGFSELYRQEQFLAEKYGEILTKIGHMK
jgi:hypothetical protein